MTINFAAHPSLTIPKAESWHMNTRMIRLDISDAKMQISFQAVKKRADVDFMQAHAYLDEARHE